MSHEINHWTTTKNISSTKSELNKEETLSLINQTIQNNQDDKLDFIKQNLETLNGLSKDIHIELDMQNVILDEIHKDTEENINQMKKLHQSMRKFRENQNFCFILIIMVVCFIVIIFIFLV